MTAQDTIKRMKQKGYYKHWILPINGLMTDDPDLKAYNNRPTGCTHEIMPWDTSLNNDVYEGISRHVNLTYDLPVGDIRKFDVSTPTRGSWTYH
jgi:hypothetical protein